jgi:hypothetical protein
MLFLAGHALFKRAVFQELPWSHMVAVLVLALLVPLSTSAGDPRPTEAMDRCGRRRRPRGVSVSHVVGPAA